ncbi:MAG TPA: triple tyrosine motif-containing protein, partial [Ferruginibacter sp.]|nr:triple tyrosine motif-containing protein [Ferruginibacter sp.]
ILKNKYVVRSLLQSPSGPVLINNGTLNFYTIEKTGFLKHTFINGENALPNNELIIDKYAYDKNGDGWYYLRGFTLARQVGNKIFEQSKKFASLGDQAFNVLFDTYRQKIIVAIRTQKYPCIFNDSTYNPFPVRNNIDVKGNVMILQQSLNGMILFATDLGIVYSIDRQNNCRIQLNEFPEQKRLSRIINDPSGDVWIIYPGRGLRRYEWRNSQLVFVEQLNKGNGFDSDNVNDMCFDKENNLWACGNTNISVFSRIKISQKNAYKLKNYFDADDLMIDNATDSRVFADREGNVYYYSAYQLICFYPQKKSHPPIIPRIQIEKVELNLEQTNWSKHVDSLYGIFDLPLNPLLTHSDNTLGFYFKGVSSSGTKGVKYSYLLNGFSDSWSPSSSNDFVSFVGLPYGKYSFKVKAQLPNSEWSEPAVFNFEIKKAFWQTWWFYLLAAFVIATGIYILFRYRLMQKIKLLEMRNQISQDLHDEIGASISGINLLSQVAAEKLQSNKTAEASEYLVKVKNYTQDVIEKLGDMVWLFNPQNDSIEKLLQRLKFFAISIASSKNVTIHFSAGKVNEMINLAISQRKAIYLVSKEAINNAVKYAHCRNIYFNLTSKGQGWKLQISDDGNGFIATENKHGNGLKNMQARADEIHAGFTIQSQPGEGTIITMEL